ncbi:DUF6056 family protein [uncultured Muribaculum sp.]|uniref:DUF6056 family protein n=1 Tax=uncultured Muribaculum sp. TaxID=1918613 RepID=UPI00262633EC|nr:DUF6056 family protein [uncultured Muribaculum sp.]
MHPIKQPTQQKVLISLIVISMFAIYAIFSWFTPLMVDDLIFWHKYQCANNGLTSPSLSGYWIYIRDLWLYENGRLANMLCAPAILWIPRWLWSAILALIICGLFVLCARIINDNRRISPTLLIFVWVASVLLLPWHDYSSLMLLDYALNYFPSSILALGTIWTVCHLQSTRIDNPICYILILIMGFAAGLFHEGFSLPLIATFITIAFINQFKMPAQWWGIFIATIIGTAICVGSPAIWERFFDTMDNASTFHIKPYLRNFIKNTTLFAFSCGISCILLLSHKGRALLNAIIHNTINQYILLTGIFSGLMSVGLLAPPRAATFSTLMFIIIWFRAIPSCYYDKLKPAVELILTSVVLILIWIFYSIVLHWQYLVFKENESITTLLAHNPQAAIYKDTIRSTPWWTLGHPIVNIWNTNTQFIFFTQLHNRDSNIPLVLPEPFKYFENYKAIPIGNSNRYFQFDDYILCRLAADELDANIPSNYILTLSDSTKIGTYATKLSFQQTDSLRWIILIPTSPKAKGPFLHISDNAF